MKPFSKFPIPFPLLRHFPTEAHRGITSRRIPAHRSYRQETRCRSCWPGCRVRRADREKNRAFGVALEPLLGGERRSRHLLRECHQCDGLIMYWLYSCVPIPFNRHCQLMSLTSDKLNLYSFPCILRVVSAPSRVCRTSSVMSYGSVDLVLADQ